MKLMKAAIVAVATVFSVLSAQALQLDAATKEKLSQEIDYIGNLYGSVYAPRTWKESHLGWNLPAQVALAQTKLQAAQTIREARQAVADLIQSTADYHVGYSFYSTEKATLPFQVKTVQGKVLIVYIDRNKLSKTSFPFEIGDEVLLLDQSPVAQIINQLKETQGKNVEGTDLALADLYLTKRSGALNFEVPQGPVMVTVKKADGQVGSVQLAWDYVPEKLNNWTRVPFARLNSSIFSKKMMSLTARQFVAGDENPNRYGLGHRKSFLPDFGERTWETDATNTFDAYIFKNEEGRSLGVVRIPEYITEDYEKAGKDFAGIIAKFEGETEGLIIDQNNNPGGSVFYLYNLASMLSSQPLKVPQHRVALTPGEAKECLEVIEKASAVKSDADAQALLGSLDGYPVTYELVVAISHYCSRVMNEFHQGLSLSSPLPLWGVEQINSNPVHFTKPIAILVNQLDFSGGDFFPAIMQDNKRATIIGVRTAGAGGYVNEAQFPNNFGLEKIHFTGSIAERVNSNPIENLGITPNVKLPFTVEDIRNEYKPYRTKVLETMKKLLAKKGESASSR